MSGFDDLIEFEDVKDKKDETVVIVDGHNIAYITVFSTIHQDYSDNGVFVLWKHAFLNKLFYTVNDLEPTKLVLAFDTKGSWRYDLYDEYKANRQKQYGRYPLDKKNFMIALNDLIEDIQAVFTNIYTIKVDGAEGDDIIAVLCKNVFTDENHDVIVVSGDTDLNQLCSQKNVRQYNPRTNDYFNVINPKKELDIKILSGDKSDNITPIKRGVGVKTAEKILNSEDGVDGFIEQQATDIEKKLVSENFERNTKLIDLDFIPKKIVNEILEKYNSYEIKELNGKNVVNYFIKRKMHDLRTRWGRISKYLKNLE